MPRFAVSSCRRLLLVAILPVAVCCARADDAATETIAGKTLSIERDPQQVIVKQGDRVLIRYRYAGVAGRPYLAEIASPGGTNVLGGSPLRNEHPFGLAFTWNVDRTDFGFAADGGPCGCQVHETWKSLRIDSTAEGERAVLHQTLTWETPDGDIILEEDRVLTVPATHQQHVQMLVWQATFAAGEDATGPLAISGAEHHGLGARFFRTADATARSFNAAGDVGRQQTNGKKAPWIACTVRAEPDVPVTLAMFDAPSNPGHPTAWLTSDDGKGSVRLSAALGPGDKPLTLEPGKTVSVCFGVAVFDGSVDAARVSSAYLQWYQLQAAARSGLLPGLIGRYFAGNKPGKGQGPPAAARIDPSIAFDWSHGLPDGRLPGGPFSATWDGQLRVDQPGEYRFASQARGQVRILVDDQPVFGPEHAAAGGRCVQLQHGYHPIRVEYSSAGQEAAVNLTWESEHFAPEIVNARYLVHDAAGESDVAMALLHDRGRAVVERFGCARCHAISGVEPGGRPGPPLGFSSRARRDYLARWLADPQSLRAGTPMPSLSGTPAEIEAAVPAIAAFLGSLTPPKEIMPDAEVPEPNEQIAKGRQRFHELGCTACHSPEAPQDVDPTLAPTLADVGAKWPESVLRSFLADPLGWHPQGAMPDFKLKQADAGRLAAYLSSQVAAGQGIKIKPASEPANDDAELVARGRKLVEQHRCAACHDIPDVKPPPADRKLAGAETSPTAGCLGTDRAATATPHFTIKLADRLAVAEFLARVPPEPSRLAAQESARRIIAHRFACFQCHTRNGSGGEQLSRAVLRYASEGSGHNSLSLLAPDLSGVGARLRRDWLLETLAGDAPSARPWLAVRMPRFAMTDAQREQIADRLATADAIPPGNTPRPHRLPAALGPTAAALVSGRGFSCVNCHYVGKVPSAGETSAPDLTMISRRVTRDWYHRWLLNPARIIPTTPMPAHDVPATGIAGEDLLVQKEVIWQFLKHTPAADMKKLLGGGRTAVSVAGKRPQVVQGRILGFAGVTRGIAVGLLNRNSLVFDHDRMAWRAHWKGQFLNEAGRHGAHHWWEPAGTQTWLSHDNSPTLLYRHKETGAWIGPALWRNRFGFLDRVTHIGRAVRLDYRLRAPGPRTGTHQPQSWVRVAELIEPNPPGADADGYTRTISVTGVPQQYDLVVQQPTGEAAFSYKDGVTVAARPSTSDGQSVLRLGGSESARWIAPPESITYPVEQPFSDDLPMDADKRFEPVVTPGSGRVAVLIPNPGADATAELVWQTAAYSSGRPIAAGPPRLWPKPAEDVALQDLEKPHYASYPVDADELPQSRVLQVPPGFKVERLPVPEDFLVCAVTFWKGKLLVGSYDGEIRLIDDTDDDGLPDRYRYFGGTLQQVNNLRVYDGQIHATSPGAVYRIGDGNGDEVADSYELLSSLWDWSGDRNDWFFGLTRDAEGNLYGANSTPFIYRGGGKPPGYYLRGDVLKITPDGRTVKVGTGTRFQFGWAENRQGRMYFNINQGHYNYTNSIHLVTEGAHYGFLEPDLGKVQKPVVRAPYPWCKSLNGMDFAEAVPPFGPFQDQGFSADYNTNQVIRWTDYAIGDNRQGACYPFFEGTDAGPTEIAFGPDGAMYVGFMCDQGWYGGQARGGLYKISYTGPRTFAVCSARAVEDGFSIELSDPADPASVTPEVCSKVHRWWHENKGAYASPEIAHEDVPVDKLTLSADGRTLTLQTGPPLAPKLYRIELKGLRSAGGRELADGLIYLTVQWAPK